MKGVNNGFSIMRAPAHFMTVPSSTIWSTTSAGIFLKWVCTSRDVEDVGHNDKLTWQIIAVWLIVSSLQIHDKFVIKSMEAICGLAVGCGTPLPMLYQQL